MCRRQYANDACNRGTAGKSAFTFSFVALFHFSFVIFKVFLQFFLYSPKFNQFYNQLLIQQVTFKRNAKTPIANIQKSTALLKYNIL